MGGFAFFGSLYIRSKITDETIISAGSFFNCSVTIKEGNHT